MTFCKCSATLSNTGTPSKQRVVKDGALLIAVLLKADDGTLNVIESTDVIDQSFVDGKINEVDASKRWYPIGKFESVEDLRADAATESFTDGSSGIVQQGVRTFIGWLLNFAPKYIDNLKGFSCQKFGLFIVDDCGNLQGSISTDGTQLKPIRVNEQSWNPNAFIKGSDTAVSKIPLSFEFSQLEADANLRVLDETEVTADLLEIEGLNELEGVQTSITTTGFVTALTIDYDADFSPVIVNDWVITDYILFNTTTNLLITITTVTEAPEGTYTFVIPTQGSADILRLTNDRTSGNKPGFALEELITIP